MSTEVNDFLLGGGNKSAKFEQPGDTIKGTVVSEEVREQTDIQTGDPLTWSNGDKRFQLVVTLQTDQRDDDDDDGQRAVYVKGSKKQGSGSLHDAVATAVRDAKAKGLETGGTLTVTHTGEEPSQTRGFSPRKLYKAAYEPPEAATSNASFLGTDGSATPAAPTPTPTPTAGDGADPVVTAKTLIGLGMDDQTIHSTTGVELAIIAALRNAA